MISYKFLQYNTDNLRLGWSILEKLAGSSDFLLLQRFPKDKQKELCNITGKAFLTESVMHKNMSLAIGRAEGLSSVGGVETINLPSSQLVQAVGNEWQGCTALRGMYNNIRLVSVLPCFPEPMGEFPITKEDNEKDIQFLLEKFKDVRINEISDIEKLISECRDLYINKINIFDNKHEYFTDKAPLNFRFIGFIKSIFPNSKIINCRRDIFDTGWSNYKNYFPSSLPFTNDLTDLSNYYNLYSNLIDFWKNDFKNDIFDIDYENLVKNPKHEVEKLLKFCGLEWDINCMSHEKNSRSIKTASATQARKPIYKSAIKSSSVFKKYLVELTDNLKD